MRAVCKKQTQWRRPLPQPIGASSSFHVMNDARRVLEGVVQAIIDQDAGAALAELAGNRKYGTVRTGVNPRRIANS